MKIKHIQIRNFRGIDSLNLNLCSSGNKPVDLALLAGPNGCGKTSVIEACLLALRAEKLVYGRASESSKNDIRKGCDDYEIVLTIDFNGENIEIVRTTQEKLNFRKYPALKVEIDRIEYFSSWRAPKLVGPVPVSSGKKKTKNGVKQNTLENMKQYLVNVKARSLFKGSAAEDSVTSGSMYLSSDELFDKINKAWTFFYPNNPRKFTVEPGEDIDAGFDLFMKRKGSDDLIPVDSLSSGEIEIITMLGNFAIKNYSDSIVFIDEPELHLHSAWHRTFLNAIRTVLPDTQIICTTHSEELLDSAYSYQRFTLLPEKDPRICMTRNVSNKEGLE